MRLLLLSTASVAVFLSGCGGPDRIALDPQSVRLYGKGQSLKLHASAYAKNGRPLPQEVCKWSSTDEKVATVAGPHNEATVTAVGSGSAIARCTIGGITAEAQVVVRLTGKVEVSPSRVELKMLDQPVPVPLQIRSFDSEGRPMAERPMVIRCANEDICRGDGRGQLWAVGPGETQVTVEIDEAKATITAHVVDGRTAEGKPQRVKGNPMLKYEKAYEVLQQIEKEKQKEKEQQAK